MKTRTVLGLTAIYICTCCTNKNDAPDRNFYFEIHKHDRNSDQLADYIRSRISFNKYTITNHSGHTWPFYKELKPDENISKDSLMPPHWFLHKMVPGKSDQQIKLHEYLVRIDLSPKLDTLPNYSVEIFIMDSTGLVRSGFTGIHYFDSTEFNSPDALKELYLKSIIRYSFK